MIKSKLLIFCFLILSFASISGFSQNCDIDIIAEVVNTPVGQTEGSVIFKMKDKSVLQERYVVFNVSAIQNGSEKKVKVEDGLLRHLAVGKYEFLVVDRKRDKCFKEILVEIKEQ
jgi:hypothetical protein